MFEYVAWMDLLKILMCIWVFFSLCVCVCDWWIYLNYDRYLFKKNCLYLVWISYSSHIVIAVVPQLLSYKIIILQLSLLAYVFEYSLYKYK